MKAFLRETSSTHVQKLIGFGVLSALLATAASAKEDDGGWKPRVQRLEAELAALQRTHLPVESGVDCGSGGTIGEALAANAEGNGLLTITVTGTCAEAVRISRSNVLLKGQGAAVVQAPAGALFIVTVDNNASNVTIRDLTIAGSSTAALIAHKGAHVVIKNSVLQQAGAGVMALDNGVIDVTGSTLRNNNNGAYVSRGGVVSISSSTLESNSIGVLAWKAGSVNLTSSLPDYAEGGVGPVVQNNTTGVVVRSGGFVELADATIQNNANGMVVDSGGAAHFFTQLTGNGNRVSGNAAAGVLAARNSSLVFSDNTNTITGNARGIVCTGNPSYIVPPGFSGASGNQFGDIVGCLP
ncbi:MAG TPA: right-handed parallel beta-helix repeat-containing protein [Steroidobacteraceae bacterium]|nr:right-handed parallel beta-helix repeat-containing protein [Steroidobacteraceae bacterium]